jgi:hypothetical protein
LDHGSSAFSSAAAKHIVHILYTGRFSAQQIAPVLAAAAPIPDSDIEEDDIGLGHRRPMPRAEALVRRLELIRGVAGINLQSRDTHPPSIHVKSIHAIAAAARVLLQKIGAGPNGDAATVPRQIWSSLRHFAEDEAENIGGFPNHPAITRQIGDHEFLDYCADRQLTDDIRGIAQIALWAERAEKKLNRMVGSHNIGILLAGTPNEPPWTGDPINDAINGILHIWEEVLQRKIGTSVDFNKSAGGPLIRFSTACIQLCGILDDGEPLSDDAVRARIRRLLKTNRARRPVRKGRRK